jgi:hypothetical protein
MGLSCFQNGKCRVFGAVNLTFCGFLVFVGVRVVSSNPPQSHSSPPSKKNLKKDTKLFGG